MEIKGVNQPISKEELLEELQNIEMYEAQLASADLADLYEIPLEIEKKEFFRRNEGKYSTFRGVGNFAFVSATIALFLFSSFFVYKGFVAKDEGTEKSIAAYESLKSAEEALKDLNFEEAEEGFLKAYENLASAENSINEIGNLTVSIVENLPFDSRAESGISLLRAAKHIAKAGEIVSKAFASSPLKGAMSAELFLGALAGTSSEGGYPDYDFDSFEANLSAAESELLSAKENMGNVDASDFPQDLQGSISELGEKIPILLSIVSSARDYSKISAFLFGTDAPKRYLVIFQNSSELRPTGGFIGSYAIIEMHEGKLKNMFVDGIYNADGQLAVNIIPPGPFQHIATAWSTHDANWFLDFPTSAEKISWFYERTGGGKVDGILTLNVEVIEQMLALTGPIHLAEYDIVLDAQNFRDEIQYEVEVAYDKELNRPKKVLSDFSPIFLERLFDVSKNSGKDVLSILIKALEQKYIMLYSENDKVQEFFEKQGWAGEIYETQNDYLAVVHSNIGGHKTDKYMQDSVNYNANIQDDGSITGRLVLRRTHNGGNTKYWWYNRANIDYVKIYVPEGSEIISYSGGARRKVKNPADYEALQFSKDPDIQEMELGMREHGPIDIFKESGKTVFGTWLVTKPSRTSAFTVEYKLPIRAEFKNSIGKYELYLQKQPGTTLKADFEIDIPGNWEVVWDNATTELVQVRDLKQSFVLDKDKVIGYILKK
jgi:hypothetical protein